MAIEADGTSTAAPSPEFSARRYRSALPDPGIGRWVRVLCGIREEILDWVPEERPRYTGFGIIVLNTGCLAALAMLTALTKIVAAPVMALVPVALMWGWIILSVDRWLISSTHGVQRARRLPLIFAPRIVLAILLALSIAEPLTLRIFQPALDRQFRSDQGVQLINYESKLKSCNPSTGLPVSAPTCDGYRLSIPNLPTGAQNDLSDAQKQQASLQHQVNVIEAALSGLRTKAQGECAGAKGPGLTGIPGVGWQCRKDWDAVTEYHNTSGLAGRQRQLQTLDQMIPVLAAKAGSAQQTSASEVNNAIAAAVQAKRRTQQGEIGLIDEWKALGTLSAQSTFVKFGHWLLWLLLIALDCLPITAKLMNGSTVYDRLLTNELESSERIHDIDLQLREQYATAGKEVEIQLSEMGKQDRLRRLDHDERIGRAERENDVVRSAEELATRWIREAEQRDAERAAEKRRLAGDGRMSHGGEAASLPV